MTGMAVDDEAVALSEGEGIAADIENGGTADNSDDEVGIEITVVDSG